MKKIYLFCLLVSTLAFSQTEEEKAEKKKKIELEKASLPKPYQELEDADAKVKELRIQAAAENKNIILQVGGNWCVWCLRLNDFIQKSDDLKNIIDKNYLYYHLNWSPKNKNELFFSNYGNPGEKQGYPVFLILDPIGKLIHVQETGSLEEGKSYSFDKIKAFLEAWKPKQ
ncbi:thioredoxin family protein [Flavobacterium luminosum]|uniref:Thioredoxin family protein n=1 Tax=Flavobacterium luminosum TaxID=2949086 RepID=A0ABT0TLJ2_9FLAO|nr:thioredoxin family protein [Flavobacterium sp. HXWNR70]MCL9808215.1 thioredoxin family protein [Flavobacterium sp. HXWNR70]